MMVSAPWTLLSPTGVLYYVRDEVNLRTLARDENLIVGSRKNNLLRELVDPANKKCLDKLPRHRAHWQLLQRVQWLQCVETEECVPVVGGDGDYFVKKFACAREDMQAFDGSRLNEPALEQGMAMAERGAIEYLHAEERQQPSLEEARRTSCRRVIAPAFRASAIAICSARCCGRNWLHGAWQGSAGGL